MRFERMTILKAGIPMVTLESSDYYQVCKIPYAIANARLAVGPIGDGSFRDVNRYNVLGIE